MSQYGKYKQRPACLQFVHWVELAGGSVRGFTSSNQVDGSYDARFRDIWQLQVVDMSDPEHVDVLYDLFCRLPEAIFEYLDQRVFPECMQYQPLKLSASGQELGGSMVFNNKVGFSGTPSNLLPVEFGDCHFAEGDDANMLHVLTSPSIVSTLALQQGWKSTDVLDMIVAAGTQFHALIDTGALVTGLDNAGVAEYLLNKGLCFDAVQTYQFSRDVEFRSLRWCISISVIVKW